MHVLQGEVAVVTGAGQGNGAAIALGLARAGARVALADINGETVAKVLETIAEAGGEAIAAQLDVTDEKGARAFRDTVNASFGPASILVNNAGVIRRTEIEGANYESDWDATFAVNVTGPRNMVRAFLPDLKTTSGCVVNLASIMSLVAGPGLTAYAASKAGAVSLVGSLAQAWAAGSGRSMRTAARARWRSSPRRWHRTWRRTASA